MRMQVGQSRVKLLSGLDLGQVQDFTAWVVIERTSTLLREHPRDWEHETAVRHMERFAPGTSYREIFTRLRDRYVQQPLYQSTLVIDQTGVGKAVMDLLRRTEISCSRRTVTIISGKQEVSDGQGGWQVPKRDLVSLLQVLLQTRKLKIHRDLEYATTLMDELQHFQSKAQLVSDLVDVSWRERPHDDVVLALALACWQAERDWLYEEWLDVPAVPMVIESGWQPWGF